MSLLETLEQHETQRAEAERNAKAEAMRKYVDTVWATARGEGGELHELQAMLETLELTAADFRAHVATARRTIELRNDKLDADGVAALKAETDAAIAAAEVEIRNHLAAVLAKLPNRALRYVAGVIVDTAEINKIDVAAPKSAMLVLVQLINDAEMRRDGLLDLSKQAPGALAQLRNEHASNYPCVDLFAAR